MRIRSIILLLAITILSILVLLNILQIGSTASASEARSESTGQSLANIIIEDFEDPDALSKWNLLMSHPEISATLSLVDGYSGKGGGIYFELEGRFEEFYVIMTRTTPITSNGMTFRLTTPPEILVSAGPVQDPSGGYDDWILRRPIQAADAGAWYSHTIRFPEAKAVWGIAFKFELARHVASGSGLISIDDIAVISDPISFTLLPDNIDLTPPPYGIRTFHSLFGIDHWQYDMPDPSGLDIAKDMGVGYVRFGAVDWFVVEPQPGIFDFSIADQVVAEHDERGLITVFNISRGHFDHTGNWNKPPIGDQQVRAFGDYVEELANRYKNRGAIYDIWGEPQDPTSDPPLEPEQFAAILKEARIRVQEVDPSGKLSTGGILFYNPEYISEVIEAGGIDGYNAFGFNAYNSGPPENLAEALLIIRSELEGAGIDIPIWVLEWGFTSFVPIHGTLEESKLRQAKDVVRQYLSGWVNGVELLNYWSFQDRGDDPANAFDFFGLIDIDHEEKPSGRAIRFLSELSRGRYLTGIIDNLPSSYYGLKLDGPYDAVIALWTVDWDTNNGSPFTVTVPIGTEVFDYLGNPVTGIPGENNEVLMLSEEDGPIYIICKECETTISGVFIPSLMNN